MECGHHGNDVKVTDEDGFLFCSMMIKAKNIIMKGRIWIHRRSARSCYQHLHQDTVPLHDGRDITVREEPSLHVEWPQRDVTYVKRSGECLNMKSRNLVHGDLMKLTPRRFDSRWLLRSVQWDTSQLWTYSRCSRPHVRVSKKSGWNHGCDPPSQVPLGKSTHIEIRDVGSTFFCFVQRSGAVHDRLYWSCVARTYWQGCVCQRSVAHCVRRDLVLSQSLQCFVVKDAVAKVPFCLVIGTSDQTEFVLMSCSTDLFVCTICRCVDRRANSCCAQYFVRWAVNWSWSFD